MRFSALMLMMWMHSTNASAAPLVETVQPQPHVPKEHMLLVRGNDMKPPQTKSTQRSVSEQGSAPKSAAPKTQWATVQVSFDAVTQQIRVPVSPSPLLAVPTMFSLPSTPSVFGGIFIHPSSNALIGRVYFQKPTNMSDFARHSVAKSSVHLALIGTIPSTMQWDGHTVVVKVLP